MSEWVADEGLAGGMPDDGLSDAWTSDAWSGDAWMDEPDPEPIPLTSRDVLSEVGWIDQARRDLECQRFIYAAEWADLHPGESVPGSSPAEWCTRADPSLLWFRP